MSLRLYERTVKEMPSRADIYFEKKFLFDRDKPLVVKADLVNLKKLRDFETILIIINIKKKKTGL